MEDCKHCVEGLIHQGESIRNICTDCDGSGKVILDIAPEVGEVVPAEEVPEEAKEAIMAEEVPAEEEIAE